MKIVWHKQNLMISSSVVYSHPVKYSYEIRNEYLSGSMAISLLVYVAIFSGSFIFGKATSSHFFIATFFEVWQGYFFGAALTSEQLLFLRSSFFRTVTSSQHFLFQNSDFSRAKFLSRNHTFRIGNSLVQLPFGTATHRRYQQKSYFSKQILQHGINFFKKSEKQYSALPSFSGELPF